MLINEVRAKMVAGKTVFGCYVPVASIPIVEILGVVGLDFVRMDPYHHPIDRESLEGLVQTAYAYGMTPGARIKNDPYEIAQTLDVGVQVITLPNVGTVAHAKAAVDAARYPPVGTREVGRPLRFRSASAKEYREYAEREILVSCQLEGLDGIENFKEIVKVPGINIIQTGRNDIANALGLDSGFDPRVLEIEDRIVDAALEAGKFVSLNAPLNDRGLEHVKKNVEKGVRMFTIGNPTDVLFSAYKAGLEKLHAVIQPALV